MFDVGELNCMHVPRYVALAAYIKTIFGFETMVCGIGHLKNNVVKGERKKGWIPDHMAQVN
jgi:hypothetical protein